MYLASVINYSMILRLNFQNTIEECFDPDKANSEWELFATADIEHLP